MGAQVGDVIEVIKTIEVNKSNEYMVLSKEGLFFIKIKQNKRPGNNNVTFSIELENEEKYFKTETVKGAFEYDDGKIIALVNGRKNI